MEGIHLHTFHFCTLSLQRETWWAQLPTFELTPSFLRHVASSCGCKRHPCRSWILRWGLMSSPPWKRKGYGQSCCGKYQLVQGNVEAQYQQKTCPMIGMKSRRCKSHSYGNHVLDHIGYDLHAWFPCNAGSWSDHSEVVLHWEQHHWPSIEKHFWGTQFNMRENIHTSSTNDSICQLSRVPCQVVHSFPGMYNFPIDLYKKKKYQTIPKYVGILSSSTIGFIPYMHACMVGAHPKQQIQGFPYLPPERECLLY